MNAEETTLHRLEAYFESAIATKEREEIILRGEISALQSSLSVLRTFKKHDKEQLG